MIFRAIFFIGLVALLMPHGSGAGHASTDTSGMMSKVAELIQTKTPACKDRELACAAAGSVVSQFRETAFEGLADVKAQLDEAKRERAAAR